MDIIDMRPASGRLAELVAQVADGELGQPTPCPSYTVGDLVDHLGGLALAFTAAARKETSDHTGPPPAGDGSRLEPGWRERIGRDLAALALTWQDPAAWDGMTRIGGGDAPGEIAGLALADELVVHGWDLAQATGRPYDVDLALVEAAQRFLMMFASPDAPAGPDVPFGPAQDLPADAPALDRLVALAGRDPQWPAKWQCLNGHSSPGGHHSSPGGHHSSPGGRHQGQVGPIGGSAYGHAHRRDASLRPGQTRCHTDWQRICPPSGQGDDRGQRRATGRAAAAEGRLPRGPAASGGHPAGTR